jgi:demethylmenaquinone methyltransferase/2-methoxy-6-polyprenyl-1,4-benzoquinol methylase
MTQSIYDEQFIMNLFDEMQDTYERVSNVTSFGFNLRWRRQLIDLLKLQPGMIVADMMGGGGETWRYILPYIDQTGKLYNIDFSPQMCRSATERKEQLQHPGIHVLEENALHSSIADSSIDAVICVYGVKTLPPARYDDFVSEIQRILKPGGKFGVVEISVPPIALLRLPYMLYLSQVVPVIGALMLGNHENFRMLSRYMQAFQNCRDLAGCFSEQGFDIAYHLFFGGCCTAITGTHNAT